MAQRPTLAAVLPAGGPVDPEFAIGREAVIGDLALELHAGRHAYLAGDRRIGKTTVCQAVCSRLAGKGFSVVRIDVPEAPDSAPMCRQIVRSYLAGGRGVARGLRASGVKAATQWLEQQGIPVDLSLLDAEALPTLRRDVLGLPLRMAASGRVVLWLDELQRITDYADASHVIHDLVDLYAGQQSVTVLVDGSKKRTLDGLLGDDDGLGKLVRRHDLEPVIPVEDWRAGLPRSFEIAGHPIEADALEQLLRFGDGHPYPTMVAAQEAALTAARLGPGDVTGFEMEDALTAAKRRLADDGR